MELKGRLNKTQAILKVLPLIIIGIVLSFYVMSKPMAENGLENLFLIPFSLTLCYIMFPEIFGYHKGGIGLKIFYVIMVIKYYVLPFLQASQGTVYASETYSAGAYQAAIAVTCLEVFVSCITIKLCYNKLYKKIIDINLKSKDAEDDNIMHLSGLLIILGLLGLMVIRGNAHEILPAMRFFLATEKLEKTPFDSYSIIALQAMKSFITITFIGWAGKKYADNPRNKLYFIASLIIAALNCMIYFGNNRSSVLQTDIATIALLLVAFKRERKFVYISIIPIAVAVMYSFIMIKQFGADVTQTNVDDATSLKGLTKVLDAYVCGPKNIARTITIYGYTGREFGIMNFIRDITENIFLFKVPGFTFVNNAFKEYKTCIDLYSGGDGAMLSVYGQMLYYGGKHFAWLLDILAYFFVVRALVFFDIKRKIQTTYSSIFIYTWLASLFGLIMCYCLISLLWSFSNTPFFLIILCYINSKLRVRFSLKKRK